MINLALVGKNIQHSRSPEIYRKLLGARVIYTLLDFDQEKAIPKAADLLKNYTGISITSPYKEHFLSEIELTTKARQLRAINCLKKDGKLILGENTDYLAIVEILAKFQQRYGTLNVIVLGDGVMSRVAQAALVEQKINFKVCSRKLTDSFDQLNTEKVFAEGFFPTGQKLIINTCARQYVFQGEAGKDSLFWDFNYDFPSHKEALPLKVKSYIDGLEMLELQAKYALAFWSI